MECHERKLPVFLRYIEVLTEADMIGSQFVVSSVSLNQTLRFSLAVLLWAFKLVFGVLCCNLTHQAEGELRS